MKTDQNSNMQGTLDKRISMKKRRNAKRALLALNLVAVIFTTTVFSNPVSVLSEEVSTDTVQSIENSPGTDAQIAEQADVQQNTAEAAQAVEAPAAEAPAAENSAEAAKAEEPSGVNAPAENAMSAEMNAAEDGVVSTDDGASSASAVQSADTSSASNGSFEDAGAGNTDGTKDGIIENDAEGLNEAEGTAANEESEDAASQEQLTYEDEHVKISVSYTDGRAFTADSILTRTYLDSDEKNAVLSAVNAQISKGNSADTVSDTAENTESSGSAPVASTTATTVEYSVAGFHALMLAAKNQDGSDTTTEGDVTFSAEFKKGLNDAGYASREETTENNEAGGDGSLTTTTTRCETSWKIYTVTEKNLTDITDITDAHNTHYEMDENGTLKSASFRGALPQTVAFVQIVKKTVTETTTQKETEKATEKETQKVTEKYTEKITGKAAEKTTETETEKEDVKAEVPASAAMPAVAFDQKVTTENGTVMVHIDAEEGAFEEGTSMTVTPVTRHDILDKAIDAAGGKGAAAAMDITFTKADGTKTEPLKPIHVKMISPVLNHAEEAHVVHVADSGTIDVVARKSDGKTIESTSSEAASSDAKNAVSFESDSFSVYAIVYTVDFHWEVDGRMYEFSLPGGGFISLSELIEVLGVAKTGENEDVHLPGEVPGIDNQDENGENQGENSPESAENTGNSGTHNPMEVSGIENQDTTALTLDGVVVSEATREFVRDVEKVEFSNPALVDVSKVEEEITVGGIKESRGLEVQYSAELTEEQIEEINSRVVEAGDWALISVQPFESTESLTVTMKTGEVFEIRVTDAQLKKTVKTAKGETWEITITYDDSAEIPEGAELRVEEILPEEERYEQYYQQSLEKVGVVAVPEAEEADPEVTDETAEVESEKDSVTTGYAHIFDIQIWAGDNQIEPAAGSAVSVSIKLLDAPEDEDTNLQVVHFGKDGLEVMELAENEDETKAGGTELNFVTDEFSVYTIVSAPSTGAYDLGVAIDGKSFALFTADASNSNDSWSGYPSDYDKTVNRAMVARITNDGLDAQAVTVENNTIAGGEATLWTFENADNHTGTSYRLYTTDSNGNRQYIEMTGNPYKDNASLTNNQNSATVFNVGVEDGKIYLQYNDNGNTRYITNQNVGGWKDGKRVFKGHYNSHSGITGLFTLASLSDQYTEYKATKISAANVQEDKEIVIYYKDSNGNLYALADDGTYVPITESGESVYWRTLASGKNILWNMTITSSTSGYYDFTSVANPDIHISPSVTDDKVMDSKYVGITLDGRQNGTYTSTIKAWDDPYYSWVGIQKDGDTATHVLGAGDEFMFAEYSPFTTGTPQEVATVDSSTLGIKIRMFDYYGSAYNTWGSDDANENNRLYGMTYAVEGTWNATDGYTQVQTPNLVGTTLNSSNLPVSSGNMAWLFAAGDQTYNQNSYTFTRDDRGLANHLFIKSVYDETGYFHYSSAENYAYLADGATNFKVYQQVASPNVDPRNDQWYFYHGHFMPYNDIDMSKTYDTIRYGQDNETEYNSSNPRTYETVYGIKDDTSGHVDNNDKHNFFTGMSMEADFAQLENGKDKNGNDVVYKFTGDDDMWVFIDGVRVLDLGGIHEALSGTINFATGEVNVNGDTSHDLYWFYQQAGKADSVKWKDGPNGHKIFADFTTHTFNMFYMERGAGASNLDLHFNLPVVKAGSFTVAKKLSEPAQTDYANVSFAYRAYLADGTVLKPGLSEFVGITYEGTNTPVTMDSNGVFYLKPGEAATIQLANKDVSYYVEELGVDTEMYSTVDILEDATGPAMLSTTTYEDYPLTSDYVGESYKVARSLTETVANRGRVTYENTPSSKNLNELHITKKVINSKGQEIFPDESTTFEFKVFLEGTDGTMGPYMQDDYYLIKVGADGYTHYYDITAAGLIDAGYLDGNTFHASQTYIYYDTEVDSNGKPVPHTVTAGSTVTVGAAGYELPVCGNSGQNGSIAKIPAGYTVVIKNLLAGTEFYVEERLLSPRYYPANYEYVEKEVVEGTAIVPGTLDTTEVQDSNNQPTTPADGILKDDTDGEVIITNRLLALDIDVKKEWENGEASSDAEIEIEIGRYHLVKTNGDPDVETGSLVIHDSYSGLESGTAYSATYTVVGEGIEQTQTGNGSDVTFTDLPVGDYTVTKTVTAPDGYNMTTQATEQKSGSVPGSVTFTRSVFTQQQVEPETATLTIKDSYSGISSGYSATYHVTGPNNYDQTFTGTGSNVEVTGLTVGASYTVEKTVDAVSGYTASPANESKSQTITSGGSDVTFTQTVFTAQSSGNTVKFYIYKTGNSTPLAQYDVSANSSVVFSFGWTNGSNSFTIGGQNYSIVYGNNSHTIPIGNSDVSAYFPQYECDPSNISVTPASRGANTFNSMRSTSSLRAPAATNPTTQVTSLEETYTPSATTLAGLPTPPEGFEWQTDSSYTKTVTLNNGNWSECISVDKTDNNGRDYFYYIKKVTESGIPEGTEASIGTNLVGQTSSNKTLTVTNNLPLGALNITKSVTVDGDSTEETLADGTYTFQIWNADGSSQITKKADGTTDIGTLSIIVKDGVATSSITVEDLTPGTYLIKETGSTNVNTMIDTSVTGYNTTLEGIVVTVSGNTNIPTAAFTNNYETTSATVNKTWAGNGTPPSSLKVALVVDGEVTTQDVTLSSTNDWSDTITGLPKYNDGTEIVYTWLEEDLPDGYFLTGSSVNGTITALTNTYQTYDLKTSYVGIKTWSDESNKYSTRPHDLIVTLYASYYDSTTEAYGNPVALGNVPTWAKDTATNQWTYTFSDLPVFDENGNVIKYSAQETQPAGYTGETTASTDTTYSYGEIVYQTGTGRTTPDNKLTWNLSSLIDLSFIAIKPTANGAVCVWTHRVPTPAEKAAITAKIRANALPGCKDRDIVWYSGTGDMTTPHGPVHVTYNQDTLTVTLKFDEPDEWSQFIWGQFNAGSGSSYNIGTTSFTNTLETTSLSGTKTWSIGSDETPANPTLVLTRTVTTTTTVDEEEVTTTSSPETVVVNGSNLQPTWATVDNKLTFTYSGLPKYDSDGNEYTYSVAEASFTIGSGDGAVTYTVVKASDGTYTVTANKEGAANFVVTQTGNDITNNSLTDIQIKKVDNNNSGLEGAVFQLYVKNSGGVYELADTTKISGIEPVTVGDTTYQSAIQSTGLAQTISGLADGDYQFKEAHVPAGYINTLSSIDFTISSGTVSLTTTDSSVSLDNTGTISLITVKNTPGAALPNTGGSGAIPYTVGGAMLMAFSTMMFLFKRRRLVPIVSGESRKGGGSLR